jgi:hypothetical protein
MWAVVERKTPQQPCSTYGALNANKGASLMKSVKYIGMDVHQTATVVAVLDAGGKLILGDSNSRCCRGTAGRPCASLRRPWSKTARDGYVF